MHCPFLRALLSRDLSYGSLELLFSLTRSCGRITPLRRFWRARLLVPPTLSVWLFSLPPLALFGLFSAYRPRFRDFREGFFEPCTFFSFPLPAPRHWPPWRLFPATSRCESFFRFLALRRSPTPQFLDSLLLVLLARLSAPNDVKSFLESRTPPPPPPPPPFRLSGKRRIFSFVVEGFFATVGSVPFFF